VKALAGARSVIWNILRRAEHTVLLPVNFNADTMQRLLAEVVDEQRDAKCSRVILDFGRLDFIDPVGVVVLSNLIEYFRLLKCRVTFRNHSTPTQAVKFLDDAGFFKRYIGKNVFADSAPRATTVPLELIHSDEAHGYLLNRLMPWIGNEVGLSADSIDAVRASLEEVLHNVRDHSGVKIGCTFAQHFPNRNRIQIAISDFGDGIPTVVRTKHPETSDTAALR
jgi:anti-anti-sigma regulatory factor